MSKIKFLPSFNQQILEYQQTFANCRDKSAFTKETIKEQTDNIKKNEIYLLTSILFSFKHKLNK